MKLIFKKIRIKNFRSVSNHTIELDLDANNTLITSVDNGIGKSTLTTHSLCFVLYGKPYGKGKKGSLVNSRNGRECLVELDFVSNGKQYTVRRGIKPDLFEIYESGLLIDQDASSRDYQEVLNGIIGIDEKILFNSVLIGKDKFIPFAEMSAQDRRNYVENMLDLDIFSTMNEICKENIKKNKKLLDEIENKKFSLTVQKKYKEDLIDSLTESKKTFKENIENKIKTNKIELNEIENEIEKLHLSKVENSLDDKSELLEKNSKAQNEILSDIKSKKSDILKIEKELNNLDTSDKCRLCGNKISVDHILAHKNELEKSKKEILFDLKIKEEFLIKLEEKYAEVKLYQDKKIEIDLKNKDIDSKITNKKYEKSVLEKNILDLNTELESPQDFDKSIKEALDFCVIMSKEIEEVDVDEEELLKEKEKLNTTLSILKDDGVKSSIVDKYMPFLNKKVNEYLEKLNFNIILNIDKEFNIDIVSPDRKGQSIIDLSSGQLRRIDLAVMLAWRDIGMSVSSLSTNLLILDETLENLSAQGVADFIEMFRSNFSKISLFVISQRENEFKEYFDNHIHLVCDSEGFTKIENEK